MFDNFVWQVKADIVKGTLATDELLEMSPAVCAAWTQRMQQYKRGELVAPRAKLKT